MIDPSTFLMRSALVGFLVTSVATSQATVMDYPDSALGDPPELVFPFYTIGAVPPASVRYQTIAESTFPGMPNAPMVVTRVGFQLAGRHPYNTFEVRLSPKIGDNLGGLFAGNLREDRIQVDLSGTVLDGGVDASGAPANQWVDYPILHPFVYQPGDALVLDVISSADADFCMSAVGGQQRVYQPFYAGQPSGVVTPDNGIKFRVVFEPPGARIVGAGCAGTGGFVPQHTSTGTGQTGTTLSLDLVDAFGGTLSFLTIGFSRTAIGGTPLPAPYSGSCELLTSLDLAFPVNLAGSGGGAGSGSFPLALPNDSGIDGLLLFTQYLVVDPSEPTFNLVVSNALANPVWH